MLKLTSLFNLILKIPASNVTSMDRHTANTVRIGRCLIDYGTRRDLIHNDIRKGVVDMETTVY